MTSFKFPNPETLYALSVSAVVDNLEYFKKDLYTVPATLVFDVYYKLYERRNLCALGVYFSNIDVFNCMMKVVNKRLLLLKCFQAVLDHDNHLSSELLKGYQKKCSNLATDLEKNSTVNIIKLHSIIELGLRLGGFLSEGAWYAESEKVLQSCWQLCKNAEDSPEIWQYRLECCHRLLHAQIAYYSFESAKKTQELTLEVIKSIQKAGIYVNLAYAYSEFTFLHCIRGEYDEAYHWGVESLMQLNPSLPTAIHIDILRHLSKTCVGKKKFSCARLLAQQAVHLAFTICGPDHPKYADALLDYGFYLQNFDCVREGAEVFELALNIRKAIFGSRNLLVASAHEELSYILYVQEYGSGHFVKAQHHSDKAISIMQTLLPPDHFRVATVKKVKALILEEVALDNGINNFEVHENFIKAEELHKANLALTIATFGEKNPQTAKVYGNMGRLYQSMKKFEESEMMHLKSIAIKEELLGPIHFEVGLSLGHLASLYNYQMKKFKKAEDLYLRSIDISLKLFGENYTGLDYDYRGLVNIYFELNDAEKAAEYTLARNCWKLSRSFQEKSNSIDLYLPLKPFEEILDQFFALEFE